MYLLSICVSSCSTAALSFSSVIPMRDQKKGRRGEEEGGEGRGREGNEGKQGRTHEWK